MTKETFVFVLVTCCLPGIACIAPADPGGEVPQPVISNDGVDWRSCSICGSGKADQLAEGETDAGADRTSLAAPDASWDSGPARADTGGAQADTGSAQADTGAVVPVADANPDATSPDASAEDPFTPDGAAPDTSPTAPNYAFVTSTTVTPGALSSVAGAVSGLHGADIVCNQVAAAAALPGTYLAWLSDRTTHAVDRLAGARGWQRTDGVPFADEYTDLMQGASWAALNHDEQGRPVWPTLVLTGTRGNGTGSGPTCGDWSDTTGGTAVGGSSGGLGRAWTSGMVPRCDESYSLYCFGIDRNVPTSPLQATGRLAFASSEPFIPGPGRDVTHADELCQFEASRAGLSGSYLALLATSRASALSRFDIHGQMWVRVDGIPLGTLADLASGSLLTALHVHADGSFSSLMDVFTGSREPNVAGVLSDTCNDWRSNVGRGQGGALLTPSSAFSGFRPSCDSGAVVYCLQE